jgi:hypothetical protein
MIFNPRSWPHPVLSPLVDDIAGAVFDFKLEALVEYDRWRITTEASMSDPIVAALVESGHAEYLLHLECRRTFHRSVFGSTIPKWEISVAGPDLFGNVEASMLIVAKRDIDGYQHPAQHSDYGQQTFNVSIGEPLAVAESQVFEAFNEPDPLRKLSSLLNIRKGGEALVHMQVICEGDRIIAVLPPEEYNHYCSLRDGKLMAGILANAVVLPALLQSLHYLRALDDVSLADFKAGHRWSRLILRRLEEMGINVLDVSGDGAECLLASQRLLRGPLRRSLADLHSLLEDPDR